MNTLPRDTNFNLTMSPLYLVKLKIAQKRLTAYTAVRSVEPIVPNFRRKSFNVRFLPCLLEILLAVFWQKICNILMGFIKNLSSNSMWLILGCKLILNCRDLRRVTVTDSQL